MGRILVVDQDVVVVEALAQQIRDLGYEVEARTSGEAALVILHEAATAKSPFQVVITDLAMPGLSGQALIHRIAEDHSDVVVVAVTSFGTIEEAVAIMHAGAIDYLTKPVQKQNLECTIERALRRQALQCVQSISRSGVTGLNSGSPGLDSVISGDPRMQDVYSTIVAVADSPTTVLMTGESGTGKSLLARCIHTNSDRNNGPFVEVSCGSIPETLLESELFGHVKGAFTGAYADKVGRFCAADGGTIFLDEINSASPGMQLKLLRVLQERQFEPVGTSESVSVDVRIVLASNQPLEQLVAEGTFRQDLYYRINVVSVELPPLRDRLADVIPLVEHFVQEKATMLKRQVLGFTDDAIELLLKYNYPGNVRELANIVERAIVLSEERRISPRSLPPVVKEQNGLLSAMVLSQGLEGEQILDQDVKPLRIALEGPERQIIRQALETNDWNRQQTADQLQINRTTLYKKIRYYGLDKLARTA